MVHMSKKQLSVTVVIPTFNEEKYIASCLEALSVQSYKISKIVVVDNNSTDNTKAIVSEYSEVEVLDEKNQGQAHARFKGFVSAKTDLIATVDADTIVEKNWLKEMVAGLTKQEADAISSYTIVRDMNIGRNLSVLSSAIGFHVNKVFSGHWGLYGSSLLIKTDVWNTVKDSLHIDQSVWEDVDLAAACNQQGYKIGLIKKPLVTTSFRRGQSSPSEMYEYLHGWYKAFRYYNRFTASMIWFFSLIVIVGLTIAQLFIKSPENLKKVGKSVAGAVIR